MKLKYVEHKADLSHNPILSFTRTIKRSYMEETVEGTTLTWSTIGIKRLVRIFIYWLSNCIIYFHEKSEKSLLVATTNPYLHFEQQKERTERL